MPIDLDAAIRRALEQTCGKQPDGRPKPPPAPEPKIALLLLPEIAQEKDETAPINTGPNPEA